MKEKQTHQGIAAGPFNDHRLYPVSDQDLSRVTVMHMHFNKIKIIRLIVSQMDELCHHIWVNRIKRIILRVNMLLQSASDNFMGPKKNCR
jgi:hypothetical protein